MYFYIDESGHTGLNLFDKNQPVLYYGMLSSKINIDLVAEDAVKAMRKKFGVDRLHAAELGVGRLSEIATDIARLRKKHNIVFDLLKVIKKDHALISFFDQTFDQGLNPAVPWMWYWSPLRYMLLLKLQILFDDQLLEKAWKARINKNTTEANREYVDICRLLLSRAERLIGDKRAKEIMADALKWAINNPEDIHYSVYHGEDALQISPNLICFQSVIHTIARRLERSRTGATKIIVDRQSQFNVAQQWLAGFYRKGRGEVFPGGIGVPELDLRHIPDISITPTAGTNSVGLELVDIYLWTFKRFLDGKVISYELNKLLVGQAARGTTNEISIAGLEKRWVPYFEQLPDPTPEQLEKARKIIDIQEMRRAPHIMR